MILLFQGLLHLILRRVDACENILAAFVQSWEFFCFVFETLTFMDGGFKKLDIILGAASKLHLQYFLLQPLGLSGSLYFQILQNDTRMIQHSS